MHVYTCVCHLALHEQSLSSSKKQYTHIHIHIHVRIYVRVSLDCCSHLHINIHTYIHKYLHAHIYVCVSLDYCIHLRINIHTYIHARMYVCWARPIIKYVHACVHILDMHACVYALNARIYVCWARPIIKQYIIHTYIHTYIRMTWLCMSHHLHQHTYIHVHHLTVHEPSFALSQKQLLAVWRPAPLRCIYCACVCVNVCMYVTLCMYVCM